MLDHEHRKKLRGTGYIRGVLCRTCNIFLAKLENNCKRSGISLADLPEIARSCGNYLERKKLEIVHPTEKKKEYLMKSSYNELLAVYTGRAAVPPWKNKMKLTAPLRKLFEKYEIEPKFYK